MIALPLFIQESDTAKSLYADDGMKAIVTKLANLSAIAFHK